MGGVAPILKVDTLLRLFLNGLFLEVKWLNQYLKLAQTDDHIVAILDSH